MAHHQTGNAPAKLNELGLGFAPRDNARHQDVSVETLYLCSGGKFSADNVNDVAFT